MWQSKGITNPFFPGSFSKASFNFDNAEKTRLRSGAEENLLTSHKMGFKSKNRKNERI